MYLVIMLTFHKWKNPPSSFGTIHYDVKADVALFWWQRLITFCQILNLVMFSMPKLKIKKMQQLKNQN